MGIGASFSRSNAFIERGAGPRNERCEVCSSSYYTLSAGITSEISEGWSGIHEFGCETARISNCSISRNGQRIVAPEKKVHYLGSYLLEVEAVARAQTVLSISKILVKKWPTKLFPYHVNICLDFNGNSDEFAISQDKLALAEFLLQAITGKENHVCECDKEINDDLAKYEL